MKKLTYNEVYECFKSNDCELLEEAYVNNYTKMQYKCFCGNISTKTFSNFQKGQRCSKCAGNKKLSYEDVFKLFQQNKCELLEDKHSNSVTKMRYRCSCGNISGITLGNFQKGEYLNAHHIKNWADNIESRYILSNGISLCIDCHNEFHSIYGYKNTNEEQISEFVTNLLIGA